VSHPRGRKAKLIIGSIALAAAGTFAAIMVIRTWHRDESRAVYRAIYAETANGPVLVVEQQHYLGPLSSHEPRRSSPAKTTVRWFSHRIADGAYLGTYTNKKFEIPGGTKDRLWACDSSQSPLLLSAESLQVVADREEIRAASSEATGGDFETGASCYVFPYSGSLAIVGRNGKRMRVTTDLKVDPDESTVVAPKGWHCQLGNLTALIEPREVLCLDPASARASTMTLSMTSALAKDKGLTELLSGVSAAGAETKVVWTKPLTELSGTTEIPLWLGAHQIDANHVAIMLRTLETRVHVIVLDPTDGRVHDTKTLFADGYPGPKT
jgi:hypothetical protein